MAELLKGGPVVKALTESLRAEAESLARRGAPPCLAIVRVGERPDDLAYERAAEKRCEQTGVVPLRVALPAEVSQKSLIDSILRLNADDAIHGILLFRPLPAGLDDAAVCAAVAPEKDVDGVTLSSMAAVYAGRGEGFPPCTAEACLTLLRHYRVPLSGKRALVLGRSLVIGKPAALLLLSQNATVTIAHSRTENLPALCREADVLIAAAGRAGFLGAEHLRPGQTVLDVGIHETPEGGLCGDVRFDEAAAVVDAITPVPGGVGAVTSTLLCAHVVESAKRFAFRRR